MAGDLDSTTETDEDAYPALEMDIDLDEIDETAPKVPKRRRERGSLSNKISEKATRMEYQDFDSEIDAGVEIQVGKKPVVDAKRKVVVQEDVP